MRFAGVFIALSAMILAGCTTISAAPAPKSTSATGEVRFGALAPRKVVRGQCGLFLWANGPERRLVFYGSAEGEGRAMLEGREVVLQRGRADGAEVLGQFERQDYTDGAYQLHMQTTFERRPGLDRGAVVQGTLRLTQAGGWELVQPVGGLVACEEG